MEIKLYNDDCLKILDEFIEKGIKFDSIITDPPYGTTNLEWDNVINYDELIPKLNKVLKTNGWLIIFGNSPFYDYFLYKAVSSKLFNYSHEIIWEKTNTSNPLMANAQPLRVHEKIMILNKSKIGEEYIKTDAFFEIMKYKKFLDGKTTKQKKEILGTQKSINHYFTEKKQWHLIPEKYYINFRNWILKNFDVSEDEILTYEEIKKIHDKIPSKQVYNPYTKTEIQKKFFRRDNKKKLKHICDLNDEKKEAKKYEVKFENYPRSVFKCEREKKPIHPTQKPVKLMEHLIKLYTKENQTVLDFTMGSGSTGVACVKNNRNFVGIEKDKKYFEIAKERIKNTKK